MSSVLTFFVKKVNHCVITVNRQVARMENSLIDAAAGGVKLVLPVLLASLLDNDDGKER
jgi:hypothetical protein